MKKISQMTQKVCQPPKHFNEANIRKGESSGDTEDEGMCLIVWFL